MLVMTIFIHSINARLNSGVGAFWIIGEITRDVIVNVVVIDEEEKPWKTDQRNLFNLIQMHFRYKCVHVF